LSDLRFQREYVGEEALEREGSGYVQMGFTLGGEDYGMHLRFTEELLVRAQEEDNLREAVIGAFMELADKLLASYDEARVGLDTSN
jgi:hypothetical protein